MSSVMHAAEGLTAWQRWELSALSSSKNSLQKKNKPAEAIVLPTAAELENMHQAAHAEGLAEGRKQGAEHAALMQALLAAAGAEIRKWEESIADDIVTLALEIARQVVRDTPSVKREALIPVVRGAMQEM